MFHKTIFLTELETALNYTCRYPSLCPQFAPLLPYNLAHILFIVRRVIGAQARRLAFPVISLFYNTPPVITFKFAFPAHFLYSCNVHVNTVVHQESF